ncbi:hypothetical protein CMEL01_16079, partial [Colletotrichum melonis]
VCCFARQSRLAAPERCNHRAKRSYLAHPSLLPIMSDHGSIQSVISSAPCCRSGRTRREDGNGAQPRVRRQSMYYAFSVQLSGVLVLRRQGRQGRPNMLPVVPCSSELSHLQLQPRPVIVVMQWKPSRGQSGLSVDQHDSSALLASIKPAVVFLLVVVE